MMAKRPRCTARRVAVRGSARSPARRPNPLSRGEVHLRVQLLETVERERLGGRSGAGDAPPACAADEVAEERPLGDRDEEATVDEGCAGWEAGDRVLQCCDVGADLVGDLQSCDRLADEEAELERGA